MPKRKEIEESPSTSVVASQILARLEFDKLCNEFNEETQPTRKTFPRIGIELKDVQVLIHIKINRNLDDLICINLEKNRIEHFSDDSFHADNNLPTNLCAYIREACQKTTGTKGPAWRLRMYKTGEGLQEPL